WSQINQSRRRKKKSIAAPPEGAAGLQSATALVWEPQFPGVKYIAPQRGEGAPRRYDLDN
ncbi:hypothetical protein TIFTF001_045717, partial [Ficus carica]